MSEYGYEIRPNDILMTHSEFARKLGGEQVVVEYCWPTDFGSNSQYPMLQIVNVQTGKKSFIHLDNELSLMIQSGIVVHISGQFELDQ